MWYVGKVLNDVDPVAQQEDLQVLQDVANPGAVEVEAEAAAEVEVAVQLFGAATPLTNVETAAEIKIGTDVVDLGPVAGIAAALPTRAAASLAGQPHPYKTESGRSHRAIAIVTVIAAHSMIAIVIARTTGTNRRPVEILAFWMPKNLDSVTLKAFVNPI